MMIIKQTQTHIYIYTNTRISKKGLWWLVEEVVLVIVPMEEQEEAAQARLELITQILMAWEEEVRAKHREASATLLLFLV